MESDADLRAPLPRDHPNPEAANALDESKRHVLRSVLCRMYVASDVMRLGTEARFTSLVLFHRYYFETLLLTRKDGDGGGGRESPWSTFNKDRMDHLGTVAAACLFLGCKAEEEHRRIRDAINILHMLPVDFSGSSGGGDNSSETMTSLPSPALTVDVRVAERPPVLDESYWTMKEKIVATEQAVLRMIRFDASVCHPHRAVLLILDGLGLVTNKALLKEAWRVLNGAVFHPPALRQPLLPLACGAICVATDIVQDNSTSSSATLTLQPQWYDGMGLSEAEIESAKASLRDAIKSL